MQQKIFKETNSNGLKTAKKQFDDDISSTDPSDALKEYHPNLPYI